MKTDTHAEVLIVGSGAGGAITAFELASAGMDVLVIEEGGRYKAGDYGRNCPEAMKRLYRGRGMTPIVGRVPIGYVEGCCFGGSTEINSGFWRRPLPELLLDWKSRFGLEDASLENLEPHFLAAEKVLNVGFSKNEWPASTRLFAKGIDAMGWSAEEIPRAARNCVNANSCANGCPSGAKQGMSRTFLPMAEAAGARIRPNCKAKSLIKNGSRIIGALVEQKNEKGAREIVKVTADFIFLCAGPIQTPALLRRSGIKRNIGNTLCLHPMLKVAARFKEEINAEENVLPLLQVREFQPEITIGGAFYSLGHLAFLLSENWPQNFECMKWHRYIAAYFVGIKGTGKGHIRPAWFDKESTIIRYDLSKEDHINLGKGLARIASMLLAGGALEIYPAVYGLPSIKTGDEANRWMTEVIPEDNISLTTVHTFSTCPIGQRREFCAADSFGKVYDLDNLYINDGSMLPGSPGVGPQGSIMALARRNALYFKDHHK